MPEELHFKNNDRIGPIITICDEGYVINTVTQTNVGNHGFSNEVVSMRAVFLGMLFHFIQFKL